MFEELKAIDEKLKEARKQVADVGEKALKAAFMEVFNKHESLAAIQWRQYTPHFNDGDACTFSVQDWSVKLHGTEENNAIMSGEHDDYEEEGFISSYSLKKSVIGVACQDIKTDVNELFKVADDEVFQLTFGDHAKIIATRYGFDVEEYDHD